MSCTPLSPPPPHDPVTMRVLKNKKRKERTKRIVPKRLYTIYTKHGYNSDTVMVLFKKRANGLWEAAMIQSDKVKPSFETSPLKMEREGGDDWGKRRYLYSSLCRTSKDVRHRNDMVVAMKFQGLRSAFLIARDSGVKMSSVTL